MGKYKHKYKSLIKEMKDILKTTEGNEYLSFILDYLISKYDNCKNVHYDCGEKVIESNCCDTENIINEIVSPLDKYETFIYEQNRLKTK